MKRYSDQVLSASTGLRVIGARVTVYQAGTQRLADLFSSNNEAGPVMGNPFVANGEFAFYARNGDYDILVYEGGRTTRLPDVGIYDPETYQGPPGPSNNTRLSLAAMRAAATTDLTSLYDGALWVWTPGNFAGMIDDATVVQSDKAAPAVGAWVRQANAVFRPSMFGAKGDGVTNDNAALRRMAAAVNALSGGVTIDGENKLYLLGAQEFAGADGKGYAYRPLHPMLFNGCTKPIVIRNLRGKYASGLHYGSFDPATGQPLSGITTDPNKAADLGYCIAFIDCPGGGYIGEGIELNGNQDGLILGGGFGDTGIQLGHYGVFWQSTPGRAAKGTLCKEFALDGFGISDPGFTINSPARPVDLDGVIADRCGRLGASIVGGRDHRIIGQFNNTGRGRISSAPGAGVNLEAENAVVRGVYICVQTANNVGPGVLLDSGDVADTLIDLSNSFGIGATSIWPNKPRTTIRKSQFSGLALNNYDAQAPGDMTLWDDCIFSDIPWLGMQPFGNSLIDDSTGGRFRNAKLYAFNPAIKLGYSIGKTLWESATFIQNGSTAISNIRGRFSGECSFAITTGSCDWGGSLSMNVGRLTFTGNLFNVPATAGEVAASSQTVLRRFTMGNKQGDYVKRLTIAWDNPTNAANAFGAIDEVINTDPVVGGTPAWVKVAGEWKRTGIIGSQQALGLSASSSAADIVAALKAAGLAS